MAPKKQQQASASPSGAAADMVNPRTKNKALKDQLANLNRMMKSDSKQLADLTKEVEELRSAVKELMKLSKREGQKPTKTELDKVIPEGVREEVVDAAYAPTRSASEERSQQQSKGGNKNSRVAASTGTRVQQQQGQNNRRSNKSKAVAETQLKSMLGMASAPPQGRRQQQGSRNGHKKGAEAAPHDNDLAQSIREKLRRASTKEEVRAATNMARALGMTHEAGLGDRKLKTLA
ncbi:hypothetical protein Pmar_PMAR011686 [Perkinsus marinus ATCC 50983]|uniref:Uncharacterized protein n=1 Tax=Perkinsus marinus (strain ATCC 50983 / TXsc) TaxID=423536 RepID=C5LCH4_PERM5|nr:hypothetical protein Pmar_PMAR011686 [Perkinsus marinus ATCC 50983]EER05657.1 hypothetical protein Pmar_PMAR011686 [Perkinsus marinus ATCC 50983]|eukprot:XP_002773841.1 hypothetical protein Pmar_PMAR011686 [Perkinsus marinus ATCC 50983]